MKFQFIVAGNEMANLWVIFTFTAQIELEM